ncbi:hypothetical protein IGI86_002664 [Enterococcus sp. AZ188]|uniref:DUF7006 family protein n=1 Tax=Enterococcus sp. AZ188 TaxID=2774678 RepID=UPI003D30011E
MATRKPNISNTNDYLDYMKTGINWLSFKKKYPEITSYWQYLELELSMLVNSVKKENFFEILSDLLKIDSKFIIMRSLILDNRLIFFTEDVVIKFVENNTLNRKITFDSYDINDNLNRSLIII